MGGKWAYALSEVLVWFFRNPPSLGRVWVWDFLGMDFAMIPPFSIPLHEDEELPVLVGEGSRSASSMVD